MDRYAKFMYEVLRGVERLPVLVPLSIPTFLSFVLSPSIPSVCLKNISPTFQNSLKIYSWYCSASQLPAKTRVQILTDPWCLVVQKSEPRMANRHAPLDLHILTTLENLESASKKIPKIYSGKSADQHCRYSAHRDKILQQRIYG